jgi:hypothetical protein
MHPDLEDFLENAFAEIEPTSPKVGRVVVEPDYEISPDERDSAAIAGELKKLLTVQSPETDELSSFDGVEAKVRPEFGLLKKYLRRVTLHADAVDGPWIEVAPPGNWI